MVKGISRQVIVVQAPDPQIFEQAIFILRDDQCGVSDEALMKEAKRLLEKQVNMRKHPDRVNGPVWAAAGALATALIWLVTVML